MNFLDKEIIHILEEVLPARFGGEPTDYQLLEEEDQDGQPRLILLVHPDIGAIDTKAVVETLLTEVSAAERSTGITGRLWRQTGLFRVERRVPLSTLAAKVQHIHIESKKRTVEI